jgi:hypothetical protein
LGFSNIGFAQGTSQALCINGFLYSNSSTLSNLTFISFNEQEPNLDSCQNDNLICQLILTQGQKKSLYKKSSLI